MALCGASLQAAQSELSKFEDAAADFEITYLTGSTGFTSPTWQGYPSVELLTIDSITPGPDGIRLTIPTALGHEIGVEYSRDLSPDSWVDLGDFEMVSGSGVPLFRCQRK